MYTQTKHLTRLYSGERQLPVDGYSASRGIVWQMSGCYYHSHRCKMTPNGRGGGEIGDLEIRYKTLRNLSYIAALGYELRHSWECEWIEKKRDNPEIQAFCSQLNLEVDARRFLTQERILAEIESGEFFGMVECDIRVPEALEAEFSEFQPIIKHANVTRSDIGEHMRQFAEEEGLLKRPTRTLLCSYFAEKSLIATPLLRWYLQHGLVVTDIHQTIQYTPKHAFQNFGHMVMDARRLGDRSDASDGDDVAIKASTAKLIG